VLIDRFLEDAFEADVDALCDGETVVIGGVMQHIEEAGIHSGDSACVLPPYLLDRRAVAQMREHTRRFALELGVVGLINVQYAVFEGKVYVIEVNPRASRTVPFVSKATGVPLARIAARLMVGESLADFGLPEEIPVHGVAVKEAVFPFNKLPTWTRCWGRRCAPPARRWGSTTRSGWRSPRRRSRRGWTCRWRAPVIITVNDRDKPTVTPIARRLHDMGFRMLATGDRALPAPAGHPLRAGLQGERGPSEHGGPHHLGRGALLINTPLGKQSQYDDYAMRRAAIPTGAVHHHPVGRLRRRRRDQRAAQPKREVRSHPGADGGAADGRGRNGRVWSGSRRSAGAGRSDSMRRGAVDTSPAAERVLIEGYRRMSPAEKLARVVSLNDAVEQFGRARILSQYGDIPEREIRLRLAALRLGRDVMVRVFDWDPEREGW
jgi:hypothetical protein